MTIKDEKTTKPIQGRPVKNIIELIDDSAENVAKSVMLKEPKKKWRYLE